jgi:tetratricopeptide (TPR) repeat protein
MPTARSADAYCEVGDFREAVEAYRKALERCPTFHDIRQRLGMALREAGLGSQALEEFNPTYLDAAVQLGLTLYTMGRSREAIAEWKRVLNRDPSRESARMYLNLLDRAEG